MILTDLLLNSLYIILLNNTDEVLIFVNSPISSQDQKYIFCISISQSVKFLHEVEVLVRLIASIITN